jgi:hypothetical protein
MFTDFAENVTSDLLNYSKIFYLFNVGQFYLGLSKRYRLDVIFIIFLTRLASYFQKVTSIGLVR